MPRGVSTLAITAVLAVVACACGGARDAGPFLRPGPLGPDNGGVPRASDRWPSATPPGGGLAGLPAGLTGQGRAPLPGARLAGIGAYRAVVVPLGLGTRVPSLTEDVLSGGYFGRPGVAGTLGDALLRESGGAFRLESHVLPPLVNPAAAFDERQPTTAEITALIRRALESWGRETDLGAFDNNGADGIPGSPDDDGTLDLVWVVLEAPHAVPAFTIPDGFEVASAGRLVRTGPVHVLPTAGAVLPDMRIPLEQTLASLGVGPSERFFPAGYPRTVSTLARVRLGWLPVTLFAGQEDRTLPDGEAVLLPLADLSVEAGSWLVERMRDQVFTSRIALRPDRHFQVTDSAWWARGGEQALPLSYHLGPRGPTVLARWGEEDSAPRIHPGGAYAAAPAPPLGGGTRAPAPRPATRREEAAMTRWLQIGGDSVRVSIGGAPLPVP